MDWRGERARRSGADVRSSSLMGGSLGCMRRRDWLRHPDADGWNRAARPAEGPGFGGRTLCVLPGQHHSRPGHRGRVCRVASKQSGMDLLVGLADAEGRWLASGYWFQVAEASSVATGLATVA